MQPFSYSKDTLEVWQDPYAIVYNNLWLKLILGVFVISITITGTLLVMGLISYEKFGGDPQKRGIFNQLIAQMLSVILVCQWISASLTFWKTTMGPLTINFLAWTAALCLRFFLMFIILTGIEYMTIKYVSVIVMRRVLPIQDDFFGHFAIVCNLALTTWIVIVCSYSDLSALAVVRFQGLPDLIASTEGLSMK